MDEPFEMPELEKPEPAPSQVLELGPPPDDTVKGAKWAHMIHLRLAYAAMTDDKLTRSQRSKEVRILLAGAAKHQMDALRYDALMTIERDRAEAERRRRGKANAQQEPAPQLQSSAKLLSENSN